MGYFFDMGLTPLTTQVIIELDHFELFRGLTLDFGHSGNFWWARAEKIRTTSNITNQLWYYRYAAEFWLLGSQEIIDKKLSEENSTALCRVYKVLFPMHTNESDTMKSPISNTTSIVPIFPPNCSNS